MSLRDPARGPGGLFIGAVKMDIFTWVKILQQVGPLVAIIIFFVWRDYRRELHVQEKLGCLEKYQREVLQSLISQTTRALTQSSECIKWLSHVVDRLFQVYPNLDRGQKAKDHSKIPPRPDGLN